MSRQQFLAELTQYLSFVTAAERTVIIAAFEEKLDDAGPEGETALMMELGTPMSIAIALKRRKEAGELIIPGEEASAGAAESLDTAKTPVSRSITDTQGDAEFEFEISTDSSDAPAIDEFTLAGDLSEPASSDAEVETEEEDSSPEIIPGISGGATTVAFEEKEERKNLTVLGAIGAALLSILIVAVFLVPVGGGVYLLAVMAQFLLAALSTLTTLPAALWLFALGLVSGALGLLIVWFFIWAACALIRRLFAGKAPKHSLFRVGLKKVWKIIWLFFTIFMVLGLGCAIAGYALGVRPDALFDNSVAAEALAWLTDNPIIDFVNGLIGATVWQA
ncbi:MAG: hypothetical protein LBM18_05865 [Oscillospiraceae bacterium]|jgi:hypothetical protein|nr:hypothetical protein [Oscillospiraceae bacterium]